MDRLKLCIGLLLLVIPLAVYWQTGSHAFINYDDNLYVTENPQVKAGLSWNGVKWAFSTAHTGNWHPLTWLSHMTDVELFGLDPQGHHLISVLLHGLNSLFLFLLLKSSTGAVWPSAFAAALFALHPLRVESVAWVAERKDVLSSMFALLSLLSYVGYARRLRVGNYLLVIFLFILGLLAKPMLVTLPFVMLLLDYWPLDRYGTGSSSSPQFPKVSLACLIVEKVPLFALAAVSCVVTFLAQQHGHTVSSLDGYPLFLRIQNALMAYAKYLGSMFYPVDLAVFYPLPTVSHPEAALAAGLVLAAITAAVLLARRRLPFLVTGWFWYLGSLVPVIGLVQVGAQARADRYTYLPMIGVAIILAWGGRRLIESRPGWQQAFVATATASLFLLCGLTWRQLNYWRDSQTLFRHAITVTDNNDVALAYLGTDRYSHNLMPEAAHYYTLSLSIHPQQPETHHNLGLVLIRQRQFAQAEEHVREAIRLMPDMVESHSELARLLARRKDYAAAIDELREVLLLQPENVNARNELEYCRRALESGQGRGIGKSALQNYLQ